MKWVEYYNKREEHTHSRMLERVVGFFNFNKRQALDLGCGVGHDAKFLLSKGFTVTAIDNDSNSINIINNKFKDNDNFKSEQISIEDFNFKPEKYDLINAQFSIFFIEQKKASKVFEDIKKSLVKDGVFCGQILGGEDEWAGSTSISVFNESEIREIFSGFKILRLQETKRPGTTVPGLSKFWHFYNVIVQKEI